MQDLSLLYPEIKEEVSKVHKEYLAKYRAITAKTLGEEELRCDQVLAKLKLVAKAFVQAGVIEKAEETSPLNAVSLGKYTRSLALTSSVSPRAVYLLNDGNMVVITNCLSRKVALDEDDIRKSYVQVLDAAFDWRRFAMDLLTVVHLVIYQRLAVVDAYHFQNESEKNDVRTDGGDK